MANGYKCRYCGEYYDQSDSHICDSDNSALTELKRRANMKPAVQHNNGESKYGKKTDD